MGKRTVIPFGPQHPILPEPVHLDLVIEDEKVIEAVPSIGFIHRGLEKLAEVREYPELVYVIERICGICSFGHGLGYVTAVEGLMGVEVPERADYLRTMWHELSRIHSHMLWLGLTADALGFESLFMHTWKVRERILNMFDLTTGGRVIHSVCKVGGVRRDVEEEMLDRIVSEVRETRKETRKLTDVFLRDTSVKSRLCGVGILSKEDAEELCAVGPVARASGVYQDMRLNGMCKYGELGFEPVIGEGGDCYARCKVRISELNQSFDIVEKTASVMPDGPVEVQVRGPLQAGEFMMRLEQPRGEALYYVRGNGTRYLERMRVRTPTNMNLPSMVRMLQGCDLADVPVIILTIDPCISCTER
ncbi:MAG: nickel-dependent hydrogenase large subunit [Candidatus Methanoplasma sp.]|nr:nickel-dependent hydrogenase large subunit [Candidatus Methanoplasma sp.]